MRHLLKAQEGERSTFRGTVARFGTKPAYRGPDLPTVMLSNIEDANGQVVTDHLWFVIRKRLSGLALQIGDTIAFDARVTSYTKGYMGMSIDYQLSYPTNIRKVEKEHIA